MPAELARLVRECSLHHVGRRCALRALFGSERLVNAHVMLMMRACRQSMHVFTLQFPPPTGGPGGIPE